MIHRIKNKISSIWYKSASTRAHLVPLRKIKQQRMIFVCGCYNSGTTLIADFIRKSQGFGGLKTEGDSLIPYLLTPEKLGYSRFPTACVDELEQNAANLTCLDAVRAQKIWASASFPKSISPVFVEKSISNSLRLDWLARCFPSALFIWVQRNPYCVAEGILRRSQLSRNRRAPSDITMAFDQWVFLNRKLSNFFNSQNNVEIIKYEDFTIDQMGTILPILKRNYFPIKNQNFANYDFVFHGKKRSIENDNDKSLSRLSVQQIKDINTIYGTTIQSAGYDIIESIN